MSSTKPLLNTAVANRDLKRRYITLLLPASAGFLLLPAVQALIGVGFRAPEFPTALSAAVFVASVCTAVALPILYRTLFANLRRSKTHTSEWQWLKFERGLLYIAMATPYVSLIALMLELQRFHLAGTLIMSFYAVYYYYPSKRRLDYDRRIFRVCRALFQGE